MPTNITDVDTFTAIVTSIADGEPLSKAYLTDLAPQSLSNRTRYLYNRLLEAQSAKRRIDPCELSATNFTYSSGTHPNVWFQDSVSIAGELKFVLPEMAGDFDQIDVEIDPGTGRAGLPATMPRVELWKYGASSAIAGQNDSSGSLAVYEVPHTITLSFSAQSYDPGAAYILRFQGEAGTNSQSGLEILSMSVTRA